MKLIRAVVAGLAVVGAVLATASPASADSYVAVTGSGVTFKPYGEHFIVCDTRPDGKNAAVQYSFEPDFDPGYSILINDGVYGTCKDFDLDFAEGKPIYFVSCLSYADRINPCSSVRADTT